MAPKRGRIIHALGRTWRHQQARSLLDTLGASGDVKVACVWGLWYADVHYRGAQCFDNVGHGLTLWTALADCLDPLATNEG